MEIEITPASKTSNAQGPSTTNRRLAVAAIHAYDPPGFLLIGQSAKVSWTYTDELVTEWTWERTRVITNEDWIPHSYVISEGEPFNTDRNQVEVWLRAFWRNVDTVTDALGKRCGSRCVYHAGDRSGGMPGGGYHCTISDSGWDGYVDWFLPLVRTCTAT